MTISLKKDARQMYSNEMANRAQMKVDAMLVRVSIVIPIVNLCMEKNQEQWSVRFWGAHLKSVKGFFETSSERFFIFYRFRSSRSDIFKYNFLKQSIFPSRAYTIETTSEKISKKSSKNDP